MPKTVAAVLVVSSPKVFDWLGHLPVMNWALVQLAEVRGLSRVECVAAKALAKRASQMLAQEEQEIKTHVMPDDVLKKGGDVFDRWLVSANGPCADADVIAVVQPTTPFLPAAKIEACISSVSRNFADSCLTASEVRMISDLGLRDGYAHAPGCRAFSPSRTLAGTGKRVRPLAVGLVESLDLTVADNYRLAKALVSDGLV